MSLTFLAKSSAYSWKMSFDGQVLWKRRLVTAGAWASAGAASTVVPTVAVAARLRKRRRWVVDWVGDSFMAKSPVLDRQQPAGRPAAKTG